MLNIYLARHGQDEDNANGLLNGHRNTPLTDIGISQAQELARHIQDKGLTFDTVYSSPLSRAAETARIIASTLNAPAPQIMPELIERDFGIMTGKRVADIEKLCAPDIIKTSIITYFVSPEGAETFPQLVARGKHIVEHIQKLHHDGSVLLVAHGDIGKMIYAAYYNKPWQEVLTSFHFGNSELLVLSPTVHPEDAHIVKVGQFNH